MDSKREDDYDHVLKILLIGDSTVGKSCLLLRYADESFNPSMLATIGIDFKIRNIELEGKRVKLQVWDTAGQERFRTITSAYYRGAMGIFLVYDITREESFKNVSKWIRNIEQHANEEVRRMLIGNKSDLEDNRQVPTAKGKAYAEEHGLQFFETSAKTGEGVEDAFTALAKEIKKHFVDEWDKRSKGGDDFEDNDEEAEEPKPKRKEKPKPISPGLPPLPKEQPKKRECCEH